MARPQNTGHVQSGSAEGLLDIALGFGVSNQRERNAARHEDDRGALDLESPRAARVQDVSNE